MDEKRQCKQCGKEYNIKRRSQLFCTPTCREMYKYEQRRNNIGGIMEILNVNKLGNIADKIEKIVQENEELKARIEELEKAPPSKRRKQPAMVEG